MATPNIRTPVLGVIKFSILVTLPWSSLLYTLCLGVEKKIFKEIMHFHSVTFMATP